MHVTDFKQDLRFSRDAVAMVTYWLHDMCTDLIDVENAEHVPAYQAAGIDLVLHTLIGTKRTIEVKSDRYHATGNYFFEIISNLQRANIGCILTCKADMICYCFTDVREIHVFNTKDIIAWFIANIDTFKTRKVATRCDGVAGSYTSLGCLVPRAQVPNNLVSIIRLGQAA